MKRYCITCKKENKLHEEGIDSGEMVLHDFRRDWERYFADADAEQAREPSADDVEKRNKLPVVGEVYKKMKVDGQAMSGHNVKDFLLPGQEDMKEIPKYDDPQPDSSG